jgi:hypothetical protein
MNLYSSSQKGLFFFIRILGVLCILLILMDTSNAQQATQSRINIKTISIEETDGLNRRNEPVEILLDIESNIYQNFEKQIHVIELLDDITEKEIPFQVFEVHKKENNQASQFKVIFQVNIVANGRRIYRIVYDDMIPKNFEYSPDLKVIGEGFGLIIENEYYRADLTPGEGPKKEPDSGQIKEITILGDSKKKLMRYDRRIHWSPNFIRTDNKINKSIAQWDKPEKYLVEKGPVLCSTRRWGNLKDFPEIFITATYNFYAHLPYFVFGSSMEMEKDIHLDRLRNDEMTTDTIFTHLIFKRLPDEIISLSFKEREEILKKNPIEADAPWLFFYEPQEGVAFGCIRLIYNNTNIWGDSSPTTGDYTKISDGAHGGKYWNRILILNKSVLVPEGSVYEEKNAYIVFNDITQENFIDSLEYYEKCLNNPLNVIIHE